MKEYFMQSERIGFSKWSHEDFGLAKELWGDKDVTKYICSAGIFTEEDIKERLNTEIKNGEEYSVQYWPIFEISSGDLIGCCGLRPFNINENSYEIGCHFCKKHWGKGYAKEGLKKVIDYCFKELKGEKIFVGHHPENLKSKNLVHKLGFKYIGDNFYKPTGLYHPSYEMENNI